MMNFLMIGESAVIAKCISESDPDSVIYILHQKDSVDNTVIDIPNDIHFFQYGNREELDSIICLLVQTVKFDAVIPCFENSVEDANYCAKKLCVPRIGDIGAHIFRNKLELRIFCKKYDIPQPDYIFASSRVDVKKFYANRQQSSVVIKPRTLSASEGVVRINQASEIDEKWEFCESIASLHNEKDGLLVEEFIPGAEYSCEYIVDDRQIVFRNITKKFKYENGFFVESGHQVPGIISEKTKVNIYHFMDLLVKKAKIETAALHAEWIISSDDNPFLVECAGRRPGDRIVDLISISYEMNFLWMYCMLLCGLHPVFPSISSRFSQQNYFDFQPGIVTGFSHPEALKGFQHELTCSIGDYLSEISDSSKRRGYIIIDDIDYFSLERQMNCVLSLFHINTSKE